MGPLILSAAITDVISEDSFFYPSAVLFVGLIVAGVWIVRTHRELGKLRRENEKLDGESVKLTAEVTKLEGEVLTRIQEAREDYNLASEECGEHVDKISEAIDCNVPHEEFRLIRDAALKCLFNRVVPKFIVFMEWESLDRREDATATEALITEYAVRELNRHRYWLDFFNSTNFLKKLELTKAQFSERHISGLDRMLVNYDGENRQHLTELLDAAKNALVDPGQFPAVSDLFPEIPPNYSE